jgi:putative tributyrin esterase
MKRNTANSTRNAHVNRAAVVLCCVLHILVFSAEKTVVTIPSPSMKKNFKAQIVTPAEYGSSGNRFPVIYLLHGYSGDYTTWSRMVPLESFSDLYHCIIVCPDGDFNSWYVNSLARQDSRFETYIALEVVSFVDSAYRTWAEPGGRAIVGASMGGHGALTLLARYPDRFCGAGSISGIMDLTEFPGEWDMATVFGKFQDHADTWKANSFFKLCENLKGMNKGMVLDCGISDFALPGNRRTHEKLLTLAIPHDFYERPGTHSPLYVRDVAECHFLYFSKRLKKAGKR